MNAMEHRKFYYDSNKHLQLGGEAKYGIIFKTSFFFVWWVQFLKKTKILIFMISSIIQAHFN